MLNKDYYGKYSVLLNWGGKSPNKIYSDVLVYHGTNYKILFYKRKPLVTMFEGFPNNTLVKHIENLNKRTAIYVKNFLRYCGGYKYSYYSIDEFNKLPVTKAILNPRIERIFGKN